VAPVDRWEHFSHQADLGIRGRGASPAAAFAQAGLALTAAITDPASVESRRSIVVECHGSSLDDLLFAWIDALVYEMARRRMLFARFEVHIRDNDLRAILWGEPVDRRRHQPVVEVKGPTYTELEVVPDPAGGGWVAQCVIDV
jgi:SHS2 domain-containing protein